MEKVDFEFARDADECLTFDMISDRLEEFDLYHFEDIHLWELKIPLLLNCYAKSNNKIISFDANYRESLFGNNKEEFIKCCKEFV